MQDSKLTHQPLPKAAPQRLRLDGLRAAVQNGTYVIDPEAIATAIVAHCMARMKQQLDN